MQTTITINDDVLATAEKLTSGNNQTLEQFLSSVTQEAVVAHSVIGGYRNGVPYLRRTDRSRPVSAGFVDKLREEVGE